MNPETQPPSSSSPPRSVSTEDSPSSSVPLFLSSSSSSLKPLRERNRTNLKRRINLSRSQVLSNDFENDDHIPTAITSNKITTTTASIAIAASNSQAAPSTPIGHAFSEKYSKTISPTTPSPIHATVTCSQVWERLASGEDAPISTSPKPTVASVSPPASIIPTHISFSYDPSDDEDGDDEDENLISDVKEHFQYVPLSSQSKLVQFQFLTFARQQQSLLNGDLDQITENENADSDDDDDDDETIADQHMDNGDQDEEEQQQGESRVCNKRKRSVSMADSLGERSSFPMTDTGEATSSSSVTKSRAPKKPKIKDPNANFQLLNMKKKSFSTAKKHQFGKNKRNAFYRRTRHAGGHK